MYKPSDTRPIQLAALRSCLSSQDSLDTMMVSLGEAHFPDVPDVFTSIKELYASGSTVDRASLEAHLVAEKGIGPEIVAEVMDSPSMDVQVAIRSLRVMKSRLEGFKLGEYLVSQEAARDNIDAVVNRINKFSLTYAKLTEEKIPSLVEFMASMDKNYVRPPVIHPGLGEIDKHYRFRAGTFNLVVAPPGVGKTALLLNLAVNAAKQGYPTLTISLEVPEFDLNARLASIVSGVSAHSIREGLLSDGELAHVRHVAAKEAGLIGLVNTIAPAKMQVDALQGIINRWIGTHGIKAVFADYAQKFDAPGKSEYERVTYISEVMTQVAKITGIPIIAASSTRRRASDDKGPASMHDIRSSGQMEFSAHTIAILSRDKDNKNIMRLDLEKNRDGGLWGTDLFYDFTTQRIVENATA